MGDFDPQLIDVDSTVVRKTQDDVTMFVVEEVFLCLVDYGAVVTVLLVQGSFVSIWIE